MKKFQSCHSFGFLILHAKALIPTLSFPSLFMWPPHKISTLISDTLTLTCSLKTEISELPSFDAFASFSLLICIQSPCLFFQLFCVSNGWWGRQCTSWSWWLRKPQRQWPWPWRCWLIRGVFTATVCPATVLSTVIRETEKGKCSCIDNRYYRTCHDIQHWSDCKVVRCELLLSSKLWHSTFILMSQYFQPRPSRNTLKPEWQGHHRAQRILVLIQKWPPCRVQKVE